MSEQLVAELRRLSDLEGAASVGDYVRHRCREAADEIERLELEYANSELARSVLRSEIERLRTSLWRIAFITGGIDTPSTSNAAHYEATRALAPTVCGEK